MIPVNEPLLGELEVEYVTQALRSGWISSSGPFLDEFEVGWAHYCERSEGVAVANGTVALEVAVAALGLEAGDEVVIPAFTIVSCVLAVLRAGCVPVLAEADPETWTMDPRSVEDRIGPRTRAIMPVHIYGHPADMQALLELAQRNGLAVVEDAAEAHGAECLVDGQWRRCGSFGDASCFSFYANKLLTTGEGGMIVTDDGEIAGRCRSLRNLAFERDRRFLHRALGHNFRLTNLQAALGVAQLGRMDAIVARKREIAAAYAERLGTLDQLELPTEALWARSVYWMYGVVLREETGLDAAELIRRLAERDVETRPFFLGMHEQPALLDGGFFAGERHPVAERLARQGLYLPSGLALTDQQIDVVADAVRDALA